MSHETMKEIIIDNNECSWIDPFRDFGVALTNWSIKWIPDAWVIAVILTILAFFMALAWGKVDAFMAIDAWGKGFWVLLPLMAQFSFSIIVAYACASAPVVSGMLNKLASIPNPDKPWQAVLLLCGFAMITAWFNWAVTIIISAMLVPYIAKHNPKTDFRLLVAAAYCGGATIWHAGLSGTATLLVATPDNFLVKTGLISELISVSRTMFTSYNFLLLIIAAVLGIVILTILTPRPEKAFTISKEEAEALITVVISDRPEQPTFSEKLIWWPGWNLTMAAACIIYMIRRFMEIGGGAWTIDMYNLTFLLLALILTWRPVVFLNACRQGVSGAWGILLQFPFYGGIFGLICYTNMGHFLTGVFTSICTKQTFLPIMYWYSGILSYFVPSGGAKLAIEAPYLLPAAKSFGISPASTTLVYAWGDMLSHLVQPFWAIPVLSITKTSFGQIAGFCGVLFLFYAIIMTIAVFFAPLGL